MHTIKIKYCPCHVLQNKFPNNKHVTNPNYDSIEKWIFIEMEMPMGEYIHRNVIAKRRIWNDGIDWWIKGNMEMKELLPPPSTSPSPPCEVEAGEGWRRKSLWGMGFSQMWRTQKDRPRSKGVGPTFITDQSHVWFRFLK